jgi:ribosomal protein S18 acetylase RimI-like enzyme
MPNGQPGSSIDLVDWHPAMELDTIDLLARAFANNPLHIAAFGRGSVIDRNRAFFRAGLPLFLGHRVAAMDGSKLVGFMHWVESPSCQVPAGLRLGLLPLMLRDLGFRSTLRVISWLSAWSKHDSDDRHWHFGPIGVDPDVQGTGVGRRMMELFCAELDDRSAIGFLETDKPENVGFYRKFGFDTVNETPVIGVMTYFMIRRGSTEAGE